MKNRVFGDGILTLSKKRLFVLTDQCSIKKKKKQTKIWFSILNSSTVWNTHNIECARHLNCFFTLTSRTSARNWETIEISRSLPRRSSRKLLPPEIKDNIKISSTKQVFTPMSLHSTSHNWAMLSFWFGWLRPDTRIRKRTTAQTFVRRQFVFLREFCSKP